MRALFRRSHHGRLAAAWLACSVLLAPGVGTAAQERTPSSHDPIRTRVEARYEVIPLRDAIGLRPKAAGSGFRMIEIGDAGISIDGVPVSGRELRDRVGRDADTIIQLSYFDAVRRRAFLGLEESRPAPAPTEPSAAVPPNETPREPSEHPRPTRQRVGDRVRVFGNVTVPRDESVDGQVVAVFGSVRVDGNVSDQVVSVFGSIDLGPDSTVEGDVVAVGGRIHRADGARVRGRVTEVNLTRDRVGGGVPWWRGPVLFAPFSGTARLFGTLFRLFVLGLLGSIAVLVMRQPVERIGHRVGAEPVKMAVVGLLAQLLFLPALILSITILALSIIGIPLLVFIPFMIVALLFVLLGGFTGAAHLLGGWAATRAGLDAEQPYLRVWLGVLLVLTPLLIARLFGIVGGPFRVAAFAVAMLAVLLEYAVWTTGFGAALTTTFDSWRTRRMPANAPPPAAS
jgi:hypothetical protein